METQKPTSATCVGCGGNVVPVERSVGERRFGGPKPKYVVDHYTCQHCGLNYDKLPPDRSAPFEQDGKLDETEGLRASLRSAIERAERAERALREEKSAASAEWGDRPIVEDDDIQDAHPVRSGRHGEYGLASYLVGAKRSKRALIDLVNWLLVRIADLEKR